MAVLTKKSTFTWGPIVQDQFGSGSPAFEAARATKINEMIANGQTNDVNAISITNLIFERQWLDQASADEFEAWARAEATATGAVLASAVTEDL